MAGYRGINGVLSGGDCAQLGCPNQEMTVLVEDYGPGGPDGGSLSRLTMLDFPVPRGNV